LRNEEECVCSATNIFIGVRIIKEMPGSVASETPCILKPSVFKLQLEDGLVKAETCSCYVPLVIFYVIMLC